ncbi:MAG: aldehyde dehydrogenase family protein, partial [Microcystaceae cyanobacterium]
RLSQLLNEGEIICGGQWDERDRYFAPTLITKITAQNAIMQEEIFGPILPILTYENLEEAIAFVNERPKPLALYLFTKNNAKQEQVLTKTSSGGVCLNDTIFQLGLINLPFGGVGESGMGNYHGKASFDTFCHYKSVLKKSFWGELNFRYPPYGDKLKTIKRFLR